MACSNKCGGQKDGCGGQGGGKGGCGSRQQPKPTVIVGSTPRELLGQVYDKMGQGTLAYGAMSLLREVELMGRGRGLGPPSIYGRQQHLGDSYIDVPFAG